MDFKVGGCACLQRRWELALEAAVEPRVSFKETFEDSAKAFSAILILSVLGQALKLHFWPFSGVQ